MSLGGGLGFRVYALANLSQLQYGAAAQDGHAQLIQTPKYVLATVVFRLLFDCHGKHLANLGNIIDRFQEERGEHGVVSLERLLVPVSGSGSGN